MLIKVYWDSKEIFLCNETDYVEASMSFLPNAVIYRSINEEELLESIETISQSAEKHFVFIHENSDFLQSTFFEQFLLIEAAGGIVLNLKKEALFIFRRGKWDLPKGKMEDGESPEICAEREIEEETGVTQLKRINKITDTYHIYYEKGIRFLKKTYWFLFHTDFAGTLQPQIEEDITSISWISSKELDLPLSNTYDSIKEVIERGLPIF